MDFGIRTLVAASLPKLVAAQPAPDKLKIGIIGAGHIGSTIGGFWVKAGHPVMFSSRHPEELQKLTDALGPLAKAGTVEEALAFGDAILLAVPYKVIPQIAEDYAPKFAGKVVLDAAPPMRNSLRRQRSTTSSSMIRPPRQDTNSKRQTIMVSIGLRALANSVYHQFGGAIAESW